jgi:hypothetical protein
MRKSRFGALLFGAFQGFDSLEIFGSHHVAQQVAQPRCSQRGNAERHAKSLVDGIAGHNLLSNSFAMGPVRVDQCGEKRKKKKKKR